MASVLLGSARTTPRVRAELQALKESARSLAARYGLNAKTVRKWRGRRRPRKPSLVAFRQKTLLPLDDVLGCLKDAALLCLPDWKPRDAMALQAAVQGAAAEIGDGA